jgi:hypothetical protein
MDMFRRMMGREGGEGRGAPAASEAREDALHRAVEAPRQARAVADVEEADHGALHKPKRAAGQAAVALALAGAMVTGVAGAAMADEMTHKGYEMPPYRVERAEGAFELRDYGAHVVAEVTVKGDRDTAASRGFRALAGYIFGGNAGGEKIAMTVPVAQTGAGGDDIWTVRFMMPAKYALADLPVPEDARIRLTEVPPERQTAMRFTGLRGIDVLTARAEDLRAWTEARGLTITAGPHFYFYDGPMTFPWNRRNEVAFTVAR